MRILFFAVITFTAVVPSFSQVTPPGGSTAYVHDDTLIKEVKFGFNQDQVVPQNLEFRGDQASGSIDFTKDENKNRCFGAFVVANLNDSDNDGIIDSMDCNPSTDPNPAAPLSSPPRASNGNGFSPDAHRSKEPDLIKVTVSARLGNEYSGPVLPGETRIIGHTSIQSSSSKIAFWEDARKIKPLGGYGPDAKNKKADANGRRTEYTFPEAKDYTFYIEVNDVSAALESDLVWVEGPEKITYGTSSLPWLPPAPSSLEIPRDRLNVTAVWGKERAIVTTRNRFYRLAGTVTSGQNGGGKITLRGLFGSAIPAGSVLPKVGEKLVIHDDEHNFGAFPYNKAGYQGDYDTGRYYWDVEVTGVSATANSDGSRDFFIKEVPNNNSNPKPRNEAPSWVGAGDMVKVIIPREIDGHWYRFTCRAAGMVLGDKREMMNATWGVHVGIDVLPKGIMRVVLPNGKKPTFDITRQAEGRQIKNGKSLGTKTFPAHNEMPNDEITNTPPNVGDNDNDNLVSDHALNKVMVGNATSAPVSSGSGDLDFDACYSVDAPGTTISAAFRSFPYKFAEPDYGVFWMRANFKEFVRVDFSGTQILNNVPPSHPSSKTGRWVDLTRCTPISKWNTKISRSIDLSKEAGTATIDGVQKTIYHSKKYSDATSTTIWKNEIISGHMSTQELQDWPPHSGN